MSPQTYDLIESLYDSAEEERAALEAAKLVPHVELREVTGGDVLRAPEAA